MKLRLLIPVLGIIVAAGSGSMRRAPGVGNSNVLTRAELAASDQQDLYRLLQALRPQWLNSRGPTSFGGYSGGPSVYLDGGNVGGLEFLRNMRMMPGGDKPKVVFCTTENDVAHIARALHAGANEYIMKPFDKEIVTAKFHEVGLI